MSKIFNTITKPLVILPLAFGILFASCIGVVAWRDYQHNNYIISFIDENLNDSQRIDCKNFSDVPISENNECFIKNSNLIIKNSQEIKVYDSISKKMLASKKIS